MRVVFGMVGQYLDKYVIKEQDIYGSSRLGMIAPESVIYSADDVVSGVAGSITNRNMDVLKDAVVNTAGSAGGATAAMAAGTTFDAVKAAVQFLNAARNGKDAIKNSIEAGKKILDVASSANDAYGALQSTKDVSKDLKEGKQ